MKQRRMLPTVRGLILSVVVGASLPSAVVGAERPTLYDRLRKPSYKSALTAILRGRSTGPWVGRFLATGNGVVTPGKSIDIDGRAYEQYDVCEPHNCFGNVLYVLFAPGGSRAWALLTKDEREVAFYGNPDRGQQRALDRAGP